MLISIVKTKNFILHAQLTNHALSNIPWQKQLDYCTLPEGFSKDKSLEVFVREEVGGQAQAVFFMINKLYARAWYGNGRQYE